MNHVAHQDQASESSNRDEGRSLSELQQRVRALIERHSEPRYLGASDEAPHHASERVVQALNVASAQFDRLEDNVRASQRLADAMAPFLQAAGVSAPVSRLALAEARVQSALMPVLAALRDLAPAGRDAALRF